MSNIKYVDRKFRDESMVKIDTANKIIAAYMGQGLKLTLRQLYYQFVARHGLSNTEKSYKGLASLISDARLAGLVDWEAIEDRGRVPQTPSEWSSVLEIIEAACREYRKDRWHGQDCYVELWVEKQALAGVLEPLVSEYHVTLMVNKGYSSQSAMWEAAQRFIDHIDRTCVLFYLGDHDPSGEDMVRDIGDRLMTFEAEVEVRKLALTMDQIREYNPPPNPAKRTDARFEAYAAEHGDESWEVDAIDPATLQRIIRSAFEDIVDADAMLAVINEEKSERKKSLVAVKRAFAEKGKNNK